MFEEVPTALDNALRLVKEVPYDLANPVGCFLLNEAVGHVLERHVLYVCDHWKVLNKLRRNLGQPAVEAKSVPAIEPLFRMRDKLITHRAEETVKSGDVHHEWYRSEIGSHEAAFQSILKAAEHIALEFESLMEVHDVQWPPTAGRRVEALTSQDVATFVEAMGRSGQA